MGLTRCCQCGDEEYRRQLRIHKEIEEDIKAEKQKLYRTHKLLLLGVGDSGKSTFIRQMKIIHNQDISPAEMENYKTCIHENLITGIQTVVNNMAILKIPFTNSVTATISEQILEFDSFPITDKSLRIVTNIEKLWRDEGVQKCYENRHLYRLGDSTKYFIEKVREIMSPNFIPSHQDILRIRIPTTGISESIFHEPAKKNPNIYRIIDVGGQGAERKKWIHCFDDVTAVIYLVSLSEYNKKYFKSAYDNNMEKSLVVFNQIIKSKTFDSCPIIMFFNKKDILLENIRRFHLKDYLPEYQGPQNNADAAMEFIKEMFFKITQKDAQSLYHHFTCATDTENIREVYKAVKDIIITYNMEQYYEAN